MENPPLDIDTNPNVDGAAIFRVVAAGGLLVYLSYSLVKHLWKRD
jgi:hypothetical protein